MVGLANDVLRWGALSSLGSFGQQQDATSSSTRCCRARSPIVGAVVPSSSSLLHQHLWTKLELTWNLGTWNLESDDFALCRNTFGTCPRPTSLVHTALAFYSGGHHLSLLEVVTATTLQVGVDLLGTLCCFDVKQKLRRVNVILNLEQTLREGTITSCRAQLQRT
jgi:hypothetical protein